MTGKEFVQLLSYVKDPADYLAITSLVGGAAIGRGELKQAKALAADYQHYRPYAQDALKLITSGSVAAENEEGRELFTDAETFLQTYFLNELTPAQKAGRTMHERSEKKKAESRQRCLDREAARAVARQVLHDPNANPADRLDASRRLEGMR